MYSNITFVLFFITQHLNSNHALTNEGKMNFYMFPNWSGIVKYVNQIAIKVSNELHSADWLQVPGQERQAGHRRRTEVGAECRNILLLSSQFRPDHIDIYAFYVINFLGCGYMFAEGNNGNFLLKVATMADCRGCITSNFHCDHTDFGACRDCTVDHVGNFSPIYKTHKILRQRQSWCCND